LQPQIFGNALQQGPIS